MKSKKNLSATARISIPFHDCDPFNIVWHGHYIKYFEAAREVFGKDFEFDYSAFYDKGFATPIIHAEADYKRPLRYRDVALITATFVKTDAAKIIFHYEIKNEKTGELICTGNTVQVLVAAKTMELLLTIPDFLETWMLQVGLTNES